MPARYVVFYSNRCDHSRELLAKLARHPVSKDVAFVCVDRRETQGSSTYAVLEGEKRVKLPAELSEVPAALLLEKGNVPGEVFSVNEYVGVRTRALQHRLRRNLVELHHRRGHLNATPQLEDGHESLARDDIARCYVLFGAVGHDLFVWGAEV